MTHRAVEEPRVKTVRSPWKIGGAWLDARTLAWAAGLAIVLLFLSLWYMLREKPLPRRRESRKKSFRKCRRTLPRCSPLSPARSTPLWITG